MTAAAAPRRRSFLDHWITRVVALLVALALAWAIFASWQDWQQRARPGLPAGQPQTLPVQNDASPAVRACLERRFAAIDDMLRNGVIGAGQVGDFRARAANLCAQIAK